MQSQMAIKCLFFHLLILASIFAICKSDDVVKLQDDAECVYTVYVKTGSIIGVGTDSNITLSLYGANGHGIRINNLELWGGIMGKGHDYFERENLDIFSGRGPCLTDSVCKMNLTSSGTGVLPGWYCEYVDVTTTGVNKDCAKIRFKVDQWVAPDVFPFQLTVIRNSCSSDGKQSVMDGSDLSLVSVM